MAEEQAQPVTQATFQGNIPPPPRLELKGNLAQNWKRWRQIWDSFEVMARIDANDHKYRLASFITYIGPEALDIYNGLPYESEEDKENMDTGLTLMERHCLHGLGETNVIYERYIFNQRSQMEGESVDTYTNTLRTLAASCDFKTLHDELIRDRIVCGLRDNATRRKLLQEPKLTLKRCIDICRATESTMAQVKAMSSAQEDIHAVRKKSKTPCRRQPPDKSKHSNPSKKKHSSRVHRVDDQCDESDIDPTEELMTIDTCEESVNCVVGQYPTKIFTTLEVNSQPVRFQVDCGATCNVISKKYLPEDTDMQDTLVNLKMYNGSKLTTMGTANLHLRNPKNSKKYHGKFVVIAEDRTPLIGSRSAQQMNFIKVLHENILEVSEEKPPSEKVTSSTGLTKEDILKTYPDIFSDELGTFEGTQKLEIDPSITPVKQPLRRIPHALKQDLKTELERLEKRGVITPVDTPTDWVSSLLIVKKPSGRLRLCIDPKPLNKALKRCHYPLPVMEDILPDIAEAKVFSKCDLKDGFWHIVLDEDSSYLTTFGTPFGHFRWLRLPFGAWSIQDSR
ncbi:uncharacterized protein K02A2.6-like [Haliotis rufescens]|uniref:uncharacterized protein K02A2.6-like n=1 Tax=Haliotis rufescens TaxID=6454 RepID=UPI00201EA456|nr:uncharacterized protein K02A2.6-like [Haliotis rufescens]